MKADDVNKAIYEVSQYLANNVPKGLDFIVVAVTFDEEKDRLAMALSTTVGDEDGSVTVALLEGAADKIRGRGNMGPDDILTAAPKGKKQ
jgi:hypothetical protein